MDFTIEKYTKTGLLEYINSEAYKNAKVLPISPDRALSHIANPRIDNEDIILITACVGNKLLGYRTAMADWIFNGNEKIKVAWISGTWIDPDYRRKGLASKLFIELNKSWNSSLIYTNYAPASKKLYDKTNVFNTYKSHNGMRFYLKFNTAEILPSRYSWTRFIRPFLAMCDSVLNASLLHFAVKQVRTEDQSLSYPVSLTEEQLLKLFENNLTKRGKAEFDWILANPWVMDDSMKGDRDKSRYFFSWIAKPYRLYFLVISEGTPSEAIFMISIKGSKMKVPYYFIPKNSTLQIGDILFAEAQKNKVSEVDLYNEKLISSLVKNKANFIFVKAQNRKYMVSGKIIDQFPNSDSIEVPDGEGDVVFV